MRKEIKLEFYLTVDCEEDSTVLDCATDLSERIMSIVEDWESIDENWEAKFVNFDSGCLTEGDVVTMDVNPDGDVSPIEET